MRKKLTLYICCILVCLGAYRWGDARWENAQTKAIEYLYLGVSRIMAPQIYSQERAGIAVIYEDVERFFLPLVSEFRVTRYQAADIGQGEGNQKEYMQSMDKPNVDSQVGEIQTATNQEEDTTMENLQQEELQAGSAPIEEDSAVASTTVSKVEKKVVISREKLQEFDYLRQNFYQIDNTTTIGSDLLNADLLLGKDMHIQSDVEGPQILIYHTHSQEAFRDSAQGDASTSIVAVGDYLETLLEERYGIEVLHHKGQYDVESRDNAYSRALPEIERILKENPTIEVVIDLHRDGVPEDRHFVTEINGKPTAQIMFFNGLSRTTFQGELEYLANPNLTDNLALSFQMQLAAAEYYPGFTRRIYLKGYRYNMHLCPKSLLVEVGAQTNTFEEAKNAMEPLADILGKVLYNSTNE